LNFLTSSFPSTIQSTTNKIPLRLRQTSLPTTPAEKCPFTFNVFYSNDKCRWFIKKQGGGCSTHIGHCHLDPNQVKARSTTLDKDQYERVLEELQLNIPVAAIQALLEKRTDTNLSYHQLMAIRKKAAHTLVLGVSSPAERLMRNLQADPDVHYVVYTAHHSMGNLISTFRVSKKDLLGMSETEVGDIGPDDDRASAFAESVMKGLSLEGGATLLLAAAWVTSEGRLYYDMFGEAMGFDIYCSFEEVRRY
jgi:hypothetical protein